MCALAGRGATARARNSARSPVVNPLQHGAGGVVHHDVAPRQYPPRDLEEPVPAHAGAARATPGEWGDVLGRPHVVEDVRAGADHGPGAEQRADRRLRMVADQAAEQLQPGLETRPRDLETHATVCVLQVRRDRAGAEVRPAADHAMAHEAVVRLVRVSQEDAARQLAARVRARADRRRAHRSAQHVGVRADPQGPLEPGPGAHLGAAFEYDRTVPYIEDDARFHGGVAQRNRGGIAEHGAPRGERVTVTEQGAKVVREQLFERRHQVVHAAEHDSRHFVGRGVTVGWGVGPGATWDGPQPHAAAIEVPGVVLRGVYDLVPALEQLLPDDLRALLGDSDPLPPGSTVLGDPAATALRDADVGLGVVLGVR